MVEALLATSLLATDHGTGFDLNLPTVNEELFSWRKCGVHVAQRGFDRSQDHIKP